jgi:hypothetical protein
MDMERECGNFQMSRGRNPNDQNKTMRTKGNPQSTLRAVWGDKFTKGKVRIGWSQTRGGTATFVSGRMEGELHDTEDEAREWLLEVGVELERIVTI